MKDLVVQTLKYIGFEELDPTLLLDGETFQNYFDYKFTYLTKENYSNNDPWFLNIAKRLQTRSFPNKFNIYIKIIDLTSIKYIDNIIISILGKSLQMSLTTFKRMFRIEIRDMKLDKILN